MADRLMWPILITSVMSHMNLAEIILAQHAAQSITNVCGKIRAAAAAECQSPVCAWPPIFWDFDPQQETCFAVRLARITLQGLSRPRSPAGEPWSEQVHG